MAKKLQVEYIPIEEIKAYENNAKLHPAEQVEQIKKSIVQFGMNDPIAVWKDNVIIEGHGRLMALKELGFENVPIIRLDDLTDEQRRAYALVHNKTTMNSDFDIELLEFEIEDIERFSDIEMADFGFEPLLEDQKDEIGVEIDYGESGSLQRDYIVPPFSVLDTRQGYWQERKRWWLEKTGNLSETRDGEYGTISNGEDNMLAQINGGTSNFDPVLAETMMKWFCIEGGHILDPFGGEQTKGVVAGELGYKYTAVEIRQDQIDTNEKMTGKYNGVEYICGDSNDIWKLIKKRDFDFCFTSPPYYDLEIYSKEDLSALGSYEEFMKQYFHIFRQCFEMLAEDTFLCIKVGEIRDKKTGIYRNFVGDTITTMLNCGFKYYNEIILVSPAGTLPMRVRQSMRSRKVGKMHQNVLVFYKGDEKNIASKYPEINYDGVEEMPVEG